MTMQHGPDGTPRYRLTIGHPTQGEEREYKTLRGARRAGKRLRGEGWRVTLWEGTLRGWGGWSWSSIDLDGESVTA